MSDQMKLSQDEIDALLNGGMSTNESVAQSSAQTLTPDEADTLGEIGNITFGSAATSLSTLLQHRVDITTPTVSVIEVSEVAKNFPEPYVLVAVEFTEGLQGSNALAIAIDDAKTIADLMLGGDGTNAAEGELNELHLSAVGEAMNQMMGGAATSMSQMFGRTINISPPTVKVLDLSSDHTAALPLDSQIVNVQFQLKVGTLIDSRIMQLLPFDFAKEMVGILLNPGATAEQPVEILHGTSLPTPSASPTSQAPVGQSVTPHMESEIQSAPSVQAAHQAYERGANNGVQPPSVPSPNVAIKKPEFVNFEVDSKPSTSTRNLSLLYDVPLNVTVELGRAKRALRDVLELTPGSVLELDKLAGEPVDILINNKRIAIGEVVVIDENFGVRVTDIISAEQRVGKLS